MPHKRPLSFCQKCRWQVTPKHTYTLDPCCPGIVWNLSGKQAHMQLVREHSATAVSAHWATVDWSWPKKWNWRVFADLSLGKKAMNVQPSPKVLPSQEKAIHQSRQMNRKSTSSNSKRVALTSILLGGLTTLYFPLVMFTSPEFGDLTVQGLSLSSHSPLWAGWSDCTAQHLSFSISVSLH